MKWFTGIVLGVIFFYSYFNGYNGMTFVGVVIVAICFAVGCATDCTNKEFENSK